MNYRRSLSRRLLSFAIGLAAALPFTLHAAPNPDWAIDAAGGQDHPLVKRFTNSWLLAWQQLAYDSTTFPGALGLDSKNEFLKPVTVEGRITRLVYFAPLGKTRLEVHRNYEQALAAAGFKAVLSCTPRVKGCDAMRYGFSDRYGAMAEADFHANRDRHKEGSPLNEQMRSLGGVNMLGTDDLYFTYGTLPASGGGTVHVMINTGGVYRTDFTTTYLEIAEPKAMATGQVTVNAAALGSSLQSDGKVALYGIYFDTGKAVLKPESQPQIDEMAKLLKAQPALKVWLVGHTDNQGSLDANLALSQQRAQAVLDALAQQHKIDPRRMGARGVASLVPVATNGNDAGRARNRRVELVVQ